MIIFLLIVVIFLMLPSELKTSIIVLLAWCLNLLLGCIWYGGLLVVTGGSLFGLYYFIQVFVL